MNDSIKEQIENCKTSKQVLDILKKNKIKYKIDNEQIATSIDNGTPKTKALDLWLDDTTRIYYSKREGYRVQKWNKYKQVYNGKKRVIPICYGKTIEVDDYELIKIK